MNFIETPFNYSGNKFKILAKIFKYFPDKCNNFYDIFAGGMTVSINYNNAKKYQCYDTNENIINLCNILKKEKKEKIFKDIEKIIEKYGFSQTYKYSKEQYIKNNKKIDKHGKLNKGLNEYNKQPYLNLRNDFNNLILDNYWKSLYFYVLIVHSYNYQFRFNSQGKFNMPNGLADWNLKMQNKLSDFIDKIHKKDVNFKIQKFQEFDISILKKDDLVYLDPPYLITTASYNENNGWTEKEEKELLEFMQKMVDNNLKFILSNVMEYKGNTNKLLEEFVKKNSLNCIDMNHKYTSFGAQRKKTKAKTREVLIFN